jgi:iron complex outermembrane receptor protein
VSSRVSLALGLFLFVLFSARNARAQEEEVVVRADSLASGFQSRATIEDAPREVTDAASLVEPLPGVHVRRLGADDSFATLSIRGSSSTEVAIYLAGVPLSGGADPTLDLATLPLWPGARARVYRSFAPAALGPGSLGGTLVLDVPSPRAPEATDVWAAFGSFGSRRLRIGDTRSIGEVHVASGISASRSDDDFEYLDPLATAQGNGDVYTTRKNAGHAAAAGLASVGIPAGRGALTITTLAQARRQELPGTVNAPTFFQRLDSSRLLEAIELTEPIASGTTFGIRAWGRREGISVHDARDSAAATFGPTSTDDAIVAAGGSTGVKSRSPGLLLEARIDGSGERYEPGTWVGATQPGGATRTRAGAGLDVRTGKERHIALAASVRGDLWNDASGGDDKTEVRPTGNIGIELPIGGRDDPMWGPMRDPYVTLAAHAGLLARPASFVERFGDRGAFIGDPSLRPEAARTIDAGARTSQRFGVVRLHGELVGFATWADDLIVFVAQGAYGRAKATNIGQARLFGLEAEAGARIETFDMRVSYTGLSTLNDSEPGGPPLPGRPEHDLVVDAAYTVGPTRVRYGIDVIAGTHADLTGVIVVPDRVLQSVGLRLEVPGMRGLSVALDVRNLFDVRVAEYAGALGPVRAPIGDLFEYPLPGRSFLASARFSTGK